ncbi:MAG TPA: helix-turn-helix transcriptional regulator, partial [Chloroflexota bacterium]|nr:helix-turn-helix transcriptional regulator [Chloroflexota bacterium]
STPPTPSTKSAGSAASGVSRAGLSSREMEVAALIAQGLTNWQIAAALVIAERTASTHVVHILNKLGVNSRTQVAAWFTREEAQRLPDLARMAKEDVPPVARRRGRHTFA